MSIEIKLELKGWDELLRKLKKLEGSLEKIGEQAIREVAENIRDTAKRLVRVDTGSLRRSIRLQAKSSNNIGVVAGGKVVNPKTGREVDYALFQELMYPYLRPAVEMHKHELTQKMKKLLEKSIRS